MGEAINLEKTFLAPGESTSFDIVVNPPEGTPLGQYQDSIRLLTVSISFGYCRSGNIKCQHRRKTVPDVIPNVMRKVMWKIMLSAARNYRREQGRKLRERMPR